jgi:hypothetical protein
MHRETGLLATFWENWHGSPEALADAFASLDSHVAARQMEIAGG